MAARPVKGWRSLAGEGEVHQVRARFISYGTEIIVAAIAMQLNISSRRVEEVERRGLFYTGSNKVEMLMK